VFARLVAGAPDAVAVGVDRGAFLAFALADTLGLVRAEAEARNLDTGDRNGNQVAAFLADKLALGDVFLEFFLDSPAHDLAETGVVLVNFSCHNQSQVVIYFFLLAAPLAAR